MTWFIEYMRTRNCLLPFAFLLSLCLSRSALFFQFLLFALFLLAFSFIGELLSNFLPLAAFFFAALLRLLR